MSTALTFGNTKTEASTTFKDVSSSHRAYKEITYLAQGKIAGGNANGRFQPNSNVTRAEATAMIGRALQLDGTKRSTSFKDVGSSNFASGYIQSAANKKIVSGYKDGRFKPNNPVTRGEMAVMISRAFGYSYGNSTSGAEKALISRGIAQGKGNGSFGTNDSIIRADFAIFLARSIDYTLRTKPTISFSGQTYSNTDALNIRKGPSTSYASIGKLKNKEIVSIGYVVGKWTLIKSSSNVIGFVSNSYLGSGSTSPGESADDDNNQSLANETIVIDPGHGGKDPGAVGFGLKEKDVVLDTGLYLKKLLAKTPFNVEYTRETDKFLELKDRVAFAERVKGDTFVSIHANAGGGTGSETYYYASRSNGANTKDSKKLAESIQARLVVAMNTKDRGEKTANFHVIKQNSMPAVLVELAFIDTKADNDKLKNPVYRQKAANAIYLGILDYYKYKGFNVSSLYNVVK